MREVKKTTEIDFKEILNICVYWFETFSKNKKKLFTD